MLTLYSPGAFWRLESSNGGLYTGQFPEAIQQTIALSGAEWQNLQWLLFVAISDAGAPIGGSRGRLTNQ